MDQQQNLRDYLASKGETVFQSTGAEVCLACWECQTTETVKRANAKLYINTDLETGLCFRCGLSLSRRSIYEHYGDAYEPGHYDPMLKLRILTESARMAHEMLLANDEMLTYLLDRGIHEDLIVEQQLGYVPMNISLSDALPSREDFTQKALVDSGIVLPGGKEFFNDSLTIPYWSHGNVIQIREKKRHGKYKTIANDSARLFNADSLINAEDVLLVEGEYDCLAVRSAFLGCTDRRWQAAAFVAVPGAGSWSDDLVETLQRFKRVFVGFDPDETGERFSKKLVAEIGGNARRVVLPGEADWSDWLKPKSEENPEGGHTWQDVRELILDADLAGKRMFSITDAHAKWRKFRAEKPGLKTGWPSLDMVLRPGLKPGQVVIPLASTGSGKGHPLYTEVPTPDGFRRWGDLAVGDLIFGADGKPTEVTGIYDRGVLPTYQVMFSDDTWIEVDGDHLWEVQCKYGKYGHWTSMGAKRTEDLIGDLIRPKRGHRPAFKWRIPLTSPVEYPERALPMAPYTLGALLANGDLSGSSAVLITPDRDVAQRVRDEWHQPVVEMNHPTCPRFLLRKAITTIKRLNLNKKSAEKFIPREYLEASPQQRLDLLRGLMDGDGCAKHNGHHKRSVTFHTSSSELALGVMELVTSLGGTAVPNVQLSRGDFEGMVSIMLPEDQWPFWSQRKGSIQRPTHRHVPHRAIVSIKRIDDQEIRCISVAAADQLYLIGREHIVTHNTVFLSNLAHNIVTRGHGVLYISLEMTTTEVFEHFYRIHRFWNPKAGIEQLRKDYERLMIVDQNRIAQGMLSTYIEEYVEAVGVRPDVVLVDYLQYFARGFRGGSPYERSTDAIMETKAVAKEESLVFVIPSQVNRTADAGKPLSIDHARDGGTIEETGDFVLSLFRPELAPIADGETPHASGAYNVQVLKSRHGGVGHLSNLRFSPLSLTIVDSLDRKAALRIDQEVALSRRGTHYLEYREDLDQIAAQPELGETA